MGNLGNDQLVDIRTRGQDASNAENMAGLLEMEAELRLDTEFWPGIWAPMCALAASKQGDGRARAFLDEAVSGGFAQPELFGTDMADAFGSDPEWPALLAAMAANLRPSPVTLLSWPAITPAAPLALFRLPEEREAMLRERLPAPEASAWETAVRLLHWVTTCWKHTNEHEPSDDAVKILERVDEGARFACVEYSTVLSQALNASGIPARRVALRQHGYHAGLGRGHVVSEAWIDDLGKWVVLDGQNGLYWHTEDGTPLGLPELLDLETRPPFTYLAEETTEKDAALWWSYFQTGSNGTSWGTPGHFVPVFQGMPMSVRELVTDRALSYPDLSELAIGTADRDGRVAITMRAAHPFAAGFTVDGAEAGSEFVLPLPPPGEHEVRLAVVTPYGSLTAHTLRYATA
ncbi:transglutaminase-like domain-containing protein [Longispora albida]|uniref:transglutaminase-like domain-containing protein n=1 Tax=Longispora albida TaxID=203523 RepID=UPI00035F2D5D|nr:transglutaminase-like domain-containing protein [Longispora albida]